MTSLEIDFVGTNFSVSRSHRIIVEYTGGQHTGRMQGGTYTVNVPYSSLSKKLQTIHRFGGKIVSVSIPHLQLNTTENDAKQCVHEPHEQITTVIPEEIPAIAIEHSIVENSESPIEIISQETPEIDSESIPENISIVLPDIISESIPAVELPTVTAKKKRTVSETTAKPKKTRASAKSSHGFNKPESNTQSLERLASESVIVSHQVADTSFEDVVETSIGASPEHKLELIAEIVPEINLQEISVNPQNAVTETVDEEISELITESSVENLPEKVLEVITENSSEANMLAAPLKEPIEAPTASLPKSKKPKSSSKSGSGFNKPKDDTKEKRSTRKPKS
ncbi:MAG: hypothetical protein DCF19_01265 [Pseudanabaena frigida]|uniref:CpcD-like domain-containing protein n=1 Tax=Pseudanabaena frigida TaxID=945775 RepID=A0A2W4WTG1_9CYAN|nr:MAG: hypothetical protein DCF19_01265 [Pseudanabaena frigida]